jgi:hypothetical protein
MDLNDYWQENKRFLVTVASGVLVFGIGSMLIGTYFGDELDRQRRSLSSTRTKLARDAMYTPADLSAAQEENEALQKTVDVLSQAAAFRTRPEFVLDPKRGSPSNQYFGVVSAVREDLLRQAGRANMRLPEDLGLPALSPTREPDIARYLESLDLIDRVVRMALVTGCERIEKIEIKLDPRLNSREGVGRVELTRVTFSFSGKGGPLVQLLLESQQPGTRDQNGVPLGGPLLIDKVEMVPARTGSEVGLDVTFACARVAASETARAE